VTLPRSEPMQLMGKAKKVTIFVGQAPGDRGRHNYLRILERLKAEGAAGATAFKAMASFGARAHVHTVRLADVSPDLPVMIVWVDTIERVERILPLIWDMVPEGLITIEDTDVLVHTTTALPDLPEAVRVGEIMTREVVAVHPETPLGELVADLVRRRHRAVPVVDAERKVVGMVTSGDLVRRNGLPVRLELLRTYGASELQEEVSRLAEERRETREVMTSPVVTAHPAMDVRHAAELMQQRRLRRLPVVDAEGRLVGLVSRVDLLRTVAPASVQTQAEDRPLEHVEGDAPVRAVMSPEVPTVSPDAPLAQVVDVILSNRFKRAVVVDEQRHVLGIVTDSVLTEAMMRKRRSGLMDTLRRSLRLFQREAEPSSQLAGTRNRARDVMLTGADIVVAREEEPVQEVLADMIEKGRSIAPVADQSGMLIGVVSRADVLAALVEE
jgi:CBS domain-containing protein